MLITVSKKRWINTDKIITIFVGKTMVEVVLDGNKSIIIKDDDREAFLRLLNASAVHDKPFPEVS
jgi:hypothetical protein